MEVEELAGKKLVWVEGNDKVACSWRHVGSNWSFG